MLIEHVPWSARVPHGAAPSVSDQDRRGAGDLPANSVDEQLPPQAGRVETVRRNAVVAGPEATSDVRDCTWSRDVESAEFHHRGVFGVLMLERATMTPDADPCDLRTRKLREANTQRRWRRPLDLVLAWDGGLAEPFGAGLLSVRGTIDRTALARRAGRRADQSRSRRAIGAAPIFRTSVQPARRSIARWWRVSDAAGVLCRRVRGSLASSAASAATSWSANVRTPCALISGCSRTPSYRRTVEMLTPSRVATCARVRRASMLAFASRMTDRCREGCDDGRVHIAKS